MKNRLLYAAILLLVAACSKNEEGDPNNGLVEIKSRAAVARIATKVPSEDIPGGARVVVSKTSGDYSTPYANGTMSFAGIANNIVGFDGTPIYYPLDVPQVYIAGFNPGFDWTFSGSTAKHSFNGSEDLLGCMPG